MEFSFIAVSSVLLWTQGFYGTIETNLGLMFRWCFHVKKRNKSKRKKKEEKWRIRKARRSNENLNVWLNKSTACRERGSRRNGRGERGVRGDRLGLWDGGKTIQQNNRLLCPTLLSLSQYFQLLQLPLSLCMKRLIWEENTRSLVLICCISLFFLFCFVFFSTLTYWSPPLF